MKTKNSTDIIGDETSLIVGCVGANLMEHLQPVAPGQLRTRTPGPLASRRPRSPDQSIGAII